MKRVPLLSLILASGLGTGYSPFAPGTVGSAFAVLLVMLAFPANLLGQSVWLVLVVVFGVITSSKVSSFLGNKDPSLVVIDEIAGIVITFFMIPYPLSLTTLLSGFLLFRLFDIWKPGPVKMLEKQPGGWGIMLDDMLAGVFANLILQVLVRGGIL